MTPVDSTESGGYFGTVSVTSGEDYVFSIDIKGVDGQTYELQLQNTTPTERASFSYTGTGQWERIEITFTATATESWRLYFVRLAAETGTDKFYVDGLQFETGTVATTYFDGDMIGFVPTRNDFGWNGTRHASTSFRTAKTRKGGELLYLGVQGSDDYRVMQTSGLGMGSWVQTYIELITGGMLYEKHTRTPRPFSVQLDFGHNDNIGEIMVKRAEVIDAIRPDSTDDQPMIMRMQGYDSTLLIEAGDPIDVACVPLTPMQNIPDNPYLHQAVLNFLATDALLPGAYNEGVELDFADSLTNANYILMRDSDGNWQEMGTGLSSRVWDILEGPDGYIYITGAFLNAGGDADADRLCKWDGSSFSSVVGGCNGTVNKMAFDNDGNLYMVGIFTDWGDTDGDNVVMWDGASLNSLGTGLNGQGFAVAVDSSGNVYVGGNFTLAGGVASTAYIAMWDGSSWNALGTGANNTVNAIAIDKDDNVYIGGDFTSVGGVSNTDSIAKWNGSSWESVDDGTGITGSVESLFIGSDGSVYAGGGTFLIRQYNGTSWSDVGNFDTPISSSGVVDIAQSKSGDLYIAGDFIDQNIFDRIAYLRENVWLPLAIDLPGSPTVNAVEFDTSGNLYIGYSTSGTATVAGIASLSNDGGSNSYPTISITGPGLVHQLKNFTSDSQLAFLGLTLLTGEILTINLEPENLTFESSFRGDCLNYVAPGSDLANFYLQPGTNSISLLMTGTDGDTSAVMYWVPQFWAFDQSKHGV